MKKSYIDLVAPPPPPCSFTIRWRQFTRLSREHGHSGVPEMTTKRTTSSPHVLLHGITLGNCLGDEIGGVMDENSVTTEQKEPKL